MRIVDTEGLDCDTFTRLSSGHPGSSCKHAKLNFRYTNVIKITNRDVLET
jgi:hypothetical protein